MKYETEERFIYYCFLHVDDGRLMFAFCTCYTPGAANGINAADKPVLQIDYRKFFCEVMADIFEITGEDLEWQGANLAFFFPG